ncbi:carbamate kinase [Streptomyces sp. HPF1205]|uniref:amino acid kinase family protein n=1 Tax=Streptomyces sp. HPF1205 TaxID=2873262 RepID=UPI001CECF5DF|nr:carbamate kinase [Streptomyces sp. HPF1205]
MRTLVHITADALPDRDGEQLDMLAASLAGLVGAGHGIAVTYAGPAGDAARAGSGLVRALSDVLPGRGVVALLTHTEVRAHDPALRRPAEPPDAGAADGGAGGEGYGPPAAPRPHAVLEAPAVRDLLVGGTVPVCAGGGGVPVIREPGTGRLRTVPRAVDPERTAVLLAEYLDVDTLLFLTGATHVFAPRAHGRARPLLRVTPEELSALRLPGDAGAPARAAADYVSRTGGTAGVGPADNALGIVRGTTGTLVRRAPLARPVRTARPAARIPGRDPA